jgi:hypothetical protein
MPSVSAMSTAAPARASPWDNSRRLTPIMTDVVREHADAFPVIVAAATNGSNARPLRHVTDGIGLDCVLDGIEQQIRAANEPS